MPKKARQARPHFTHAAETLLSHPQFSRAAMIAALAAAKAVSAASCMPDMAYSRLRRADVGRSEREAGMRWQNLPRLGVADLRRRYAEVFGEPTRTGNKAWLVKRIAWRLQALAADARVRRAAAAAAGKLTVRQVIEPLLVMRGEGDEAALRQPGQLEWRGCGEAGALLQSPRSG